MSSVLAAVFFFHEMEIVHRDIKPENVLWNKKLEFKLSDFGFSAGYTEKTGRKTMCGTAEYMAPEIIESQPQNDKVDIWCLGILLYELVHQTTPFESRNMYTLLNEIKTKKVVVAPNVRKDFREFIEACIVADPRKRPTAKSLLERFPVFDLRKDSSKQTPPQTVPKTEGPFGKPKPNIQNANFKKKAQTTSSVSTLQPATPQGQHYQAHNTPAKTTSGQQPVTPKQQHYSTEDLPVKSSNDQQSAPQRQQPYQSHNPLAKPAKEQSEPDRVASDRTLSDPKIKHISSMKTLIKAPELSDSYPANRDAYRVVNNDLLTQPPSNHNPVDSKQNGQPHIETRKLKLCNSPKELTSITLKFEQVSSNKTQTAPNFSKQTSNGDRKHALQLNRFTAFESPMKPGLNPKEQTPLLSNGDVKVRTYSAQNEPFKGFSSSNQHDGRDPQLNFGSGWTAVRNEYTLEDQRNTNGGPPLAKTTEYRLNPEGLVNIYHKVDTPFSEKRTTPNYQPVQREPVSLTHRTRNVHSETVVPFSNDRPYVRGEEGSFGAPVTKTHNYYEESNPRTAPQRQTYSSVENKRLTFKDTPQVFAKFSEYDLVATSSRNNLVKSNFRRVTDSDSRRESKNELEGQPIGGFSSSTQNATDKLARSLEKNYESRNGSGLKGEQLRYKLQSRRLRDDEFRDDKSITYKAFAQTHF